MREPRGSLSRRTPSPWWNRVGGVLRSTSMTAPGRPMVSVRFLLCELGPQVSQVERDLHRVQPSGLEGVRDRVPVVTKPEQGAGQIVQRQVGRSRDSQIERALACHLGPVGVGTGHVQLTLPDRPPVDLLLTGHADDDQPASRPREPDGIVEATSRAGALERHIRTTEQQGPVQAVQAPRLGRKADALEDFVGPDDEVAAQPLGLLALKGILCDHDQPPRWREEADSRDGEQADGARALHDHDVALARASPQRCVHTAGERLEKDGSFVGQAVGHRVELTLMGDQDFAPAAAGGGAVAGLEANRDGSLGHVLAEADAPFRTVPAGRRETTDATAQGRLDNHSSTVVELTNDLVAGHEGIAGERVEIERGVSRDGGRVRPTNAAHAGSDTHPAWTGRSRLRDVAQVEHREVTRRDAGVSSRRPDQRVGGYRSVVLECEHQRRTPSRYCGERGSGMGSRQLPGAIPHRSIRQPRCPPTWDKRASGLTTTGVPTSSSMGRSEIASAYAKLSVRSTSRLPAYSSSSAALASPAGGGDSKSPVSRPSFTSRCAQFRSTSSSSASGWTTTSRAPVRSSTL